MIYIYIYIYIYMYVHIVYHNYIKIQTWMAVKTQLMDGCRHTPASRLKWPGQRAEVLTHIQQLDPRMVVVMGHKGQKCPKK